MGKRKAFVGVTGLRRSGNSDRSHVRPKMATSSSLPSTVTYEENFLSQKAASAIFDQLKRDVPFSQGEIKMFGKLVKEPRLTAWYGGAYKYSGKPLAARPLDEVTALVELRDLLIAKLDVRFNSVLLNLYRDENDYMGWHADDERAMGPSKDDVVVASVSLGATRSFLLKRKDGDGDKVTVELKSGSLLVMRGDTQEHWKHMIPKTKTLKKERINLTFRCILSTI